jgi:hypothetical protein
MITTQVSTLLIISQLAFSQVAGAMPTINPEPQKVVLSERAISLNKRQVNKPLNDIYKDNILLNMAYMRGVVSKEVPLDWDVIRAPFTYEFTLKPGESFAYHNLVLPEYQNKPVYAAGTHFGGSEGYKYDGRLYGMGVCHSASVINWAAKDAGLKVLAPTNHDFFPINEVPKEHGVAIYADPGATGVSAKQNLYITNNKESDVVFQFNFDGDNLKVSVLQ